MNPKTYDALLLITIVCFITRPLWATVTTYTQANAWQNAMGTYTTITFTELPPQPITNQYAALGVMFIDSSDFLVHTPGAFVNDGYGLIDNGDSTITMQFTAPMFGIAAHHPGTVLFKLFNSAGDLFYTGPLMGGSGLGFFSGLISTEPFAKVVVSDPAIGVAIDDLHFGPPIPAPGTLAVLALGALGACRRRRFA